MIAAGGHRPERTCVGCRKRDGLAALVRLAAACDGEAGPSAGTGLLAGPDRYHVVVDARRRRPGRGAWVHPDPRCTRRLAVGALERGLRRRLGPDALTGVAEQIAAPTSSSRQPEPDRVELPPASAGGINGRPAEPK